MLGWLMALPHSKGHNHSLSHPALGKDKSPTSPFHPNSGELMVQGTAVNLSSMRGDDRMMLWLDGKRKHLPSYSMYPWLKVSETPNITHGGDASKAFPLLSVHSWTHRGQKSEPSVSLPHARVQQDRVQGGDRHRGGSAHMCASRSPSAGQKSSSSTPHPSQSTGVYRQA